MTDPRLDKALRLLRDFVRAPLLGGVPRPRHLTSDEEWAIGVLLEHHDSEVSV